MRKVQIAPRLKGAIAFLSHCPKGVGTTTRTSEVNILYIKSHTWSPGNVLAVRGKTFGDEWLSHLVTVHSSQWGRRSSKTAFRLFASLCRIEGQKQRRNVQIMYPVAWFESPNRGHTSFGVLKAPLPHLEHNDVSKMGSSVNTSTILLIYDAFPSSNKTAWLMSILWSSTI